MKRINIAVRDKTPVFYFEADIKSMFALSVAPLPKRGAGTEQDVRYMLLERWWAARAVTEGKRKEFEEFRLLREVAVWGLYTNFAPGTPGGCSVIASLEHMFKSEEEARAVLIVRAAEWLGVSEEEAAQIIHDREIQQRELYATYSADKEHKSKAEQAKADKAQADYMKESGKALNDGRLTFFGI